MQLIVFHFERKNYYFFARNFNFFNLNISILFYETLPQKTRTIDAKTWLCRHIGFMSLCLCLSKDEL